VTQSVTLRRKAPKGLGQFEPAGDGQRVHRRVVDDDLRNPLVDDVGDAHRTLQTLSDSLLDFGATVVREA